MRKTVKINSNANKISFLFYRLHFIISCTHIQNMVMYSKFPDSFYLHILYFHFCCVYQPFFRLINVLTHKQPMKDCVIASIIAT